MSPTTFEDRLLSELRAVVAARPAPAPTPAVAKRSRRPARLLVGAAAVAAATATAVVIAGGGGTAAPAFAVERQADGSVDVEINSLRDADGLEEKLRAVGIAAVVDFTPAGKTCRQPRGRAATRPHSGPHTLGLRVRPDGSARFTIGRGDVQPGQTLVITAAKVTGLTSLGTQIVEGPVAPCELIDAPMPPAAPSGRSTGPEQGHSSNSDEDGPSTHVGP
ncbi:MAG TPA: hypothetical protein VGJ32_13120 [Solirubrobacteraceae bacterium]